MPNKHASFSSDVDFIITLVRAKCNNLNQFFSFVIKLLTFYIIFVYKDAKIWNRLRFF